MWARPRPRSYLLAAGVAAVDVVDTGLLVGALGTGLLVGALVLAVRLLVFDAPLRDAATLAAGAAAGAALVGGALAAA